MPVRIFSSQFPDYLISINSGSPSLQIDTGNSLDIWNIGLRYNYINQMGFNKYLTVFNNGLTVALGTSQSQWFQFILSSDGKSFQIKSSFISQCLSAQSAGAVISLSICDTSDLSQMWLFNFAAPSISSKVSISSYSGLLITKTNSGTYDPGTGLTIAYAAMAQTNGLIQSFVLEK